MKLDLKLGGLAAAVIAVFLTFSGTQHGELTVPAVTAELDITFSTTDTGSEKYIIGSLTDSTVYVSYAGDTNTLVFSTDVLLSDSSVVLNDGETHTLKYKEVGGIVTLYIDGDEITSLAADLATIEWGYVGTNKDKDKKFDGVINSIDFIGDQTYIIDSTSVVEEVSEQGTEAITFVNVRKPDWSNFVDPAIYIATTTPVASWSLDELAGVFVEDINGYDGIAVGSLTRGVDPLTQLDGNSIELVYGVKGHMDAGLHAPLQIVGDLTMHFAMNLTSVTAGENQMIIDQYSNQGSTSEYNIMYRAYMRDGEMVVQHQHGSSITTTLTFSFPFKVTTDYVIDITRDATDKEYRLFVDGALVGQGGYTDNPEGGSLTSFYAGDFGDQVDNGTFDGKLDSMIIYNRVLDEDAVAALYSNVYLLEAFSVLPLIVTYTTTVPDQTIDIRTRAGYNYKYYIDWGDGSPEEYYTGDGSHIYAVANNHEVTIRGIFAGWYHSTYDAFELTEVKQWGTQKLTTMYTAFENASNLTFSATNAPDLTHCPSLTRAFYSITELHGDISHWDTSNIAYLNESFYGCGSAGTIDISGWDTSNVVSLLNMCNTCALQLDMSLWDMSAVTTMNHAFYGTNFTTDWGISNWNVSSVQSFEGMFYFSNYNYPLNSWVTTSALTLEDMFYSCTEFNQPIDNWDVSSVTTMDSMFRSAQSFNQSLTGWDVSSVTHFNNMFIYAGGFNSNINNWNLASCVSIYRMFYDAGSFNGTLNNWILPVAAPGTLSMRGMFERADVFNNDSLTTWTNTSAIGSIQETFKDAWLFNGSLAGWDFSNVTSMLEAFNNASAFNQDIGGWGIGSVTTMVDMFTGTTSFTQANYDNLLVGWATLANGTGVQPNVTFNMNSTTQYSATSADDRLVLTDPPNSWIITDGGQA